MRRLFAAREINWGKWGAIAGIVCTIIAVVALAQQCGVFPETLTPTETPPEASPSPSPTPTLTPSPTPTLTPSPTTLLLATPPPTPIPPPTPYTPWIYVVAQDDVRVDDLLSLAHFFYGDENRWEDICEANSSVIGIRASAEEIPPLTRGQVLFLHGLPERITHVVAEGETLSRIARLYYGEAYDTDRFWMYIWSHNIDTIPDPNSLHGGEKLLIMPLETPEPGQLLTRPGDTFAQLARAFHGTVQQRGSLCGQNQNVIREGDCADVLVGLPIHLSDLLDPQTYTVKEGDRWETIAAQCDRSMIWAVDMALVVNREVVGGAPEDCPSPYGEDCKLPPLRMGHVLILYGCRRELGTTD